MSEWQMTHDDGRTQTVGVGTLPGRKSPALFVIEQGTVTALAYFRSTWDAERTDKLLATMARSRLLTDD